jgi:hypothetical protein
MNARWGVAYPIERHVSAPLLCDFQRALTGFRNSVTNRPQRLYPDRLWHFQLAGDFADKNCSRLDGARRAFAFRHR